MKKSYQTITVMNHTHVICELNDRKGYPNPNYMNTGMALCGVLKKDETIDAWIKRTHRN